MRKLVCLSVVFINFKHAIEILKKHEQKDYHKEDVVKMDSFVKVMSGQQDSISVQLNDVAKELVATNRKKLQSIIETIICLWTTEYTTTWSSCWYRLRACVWEGHGNVWALLQFQFSSGEQRENLDNAPRNATFIYRTR